MMRIEAFTVGPLASNCYLVYDDAAREGAMIDLGHWDPRLSARVTALDLSVRGIYLTHGHFDHVDGVNSAREAWPDAVTWMHPGDIEVLRGQGDLVAEFLPGAEYVPPRIDHELADGQVLAVGNAEVRVAHTPGHTPGGVCFIGEGIVFVGDTLFRDGIGRADLPGGDEATLLASIRERLLTLPGETRVLSGHGPETTIAREIARNPFL